MKRKPVVALVGRPNVGKSTLFNRMAGKRLAVVDDTPGTTRDRLHTESEWIGVPFIIVDTGGIDPTKVKVAPGKEPLSIGSKDFIKEIRFQAEVAITDADAVLFLVDSEHGVTPADREVATILREKQKEVNGKLFPPVLLVVNKCESQAARDAAYEFYELGMGEPFAISAMHGNGVGDVLDELIISLGLTYKDFQDDEEAEDDSISIAIVGKPNAGKSSILNQLLGEERAIVSEIAGTTRDSVDSYLEFEGEHLTLIDTAGIRKRGKIEPGVEKYSVLRSMRAISRADVSLLVMDATTGITAQDTHIAGFILDEWKSAVVVVNKWDAVEKNTYTMDQYKQILREELNFMDYVPILFVSAKSGQRIDQILPTAIQVRQERYMRLSTAQVNRIIRDAMTRHAPPSKAGRLLKIFYGTQVRVDPPTFILYVNEPELLHFGYIRYLENRLRDVYGFTGTPIKIIGKARKKVELSPKKKKK
ncbi:MAG: ribosome biogenesis GTPase Der [Anaerolineales bacterium]|nr:ribosome biogenesis GTPase Der [Anaerolineales bacterium]